MFIIILLLNLLQNVNSYTIYIGAGITCSGLIGAGAGIRLFSSLFYSILFNFFE
jgi:hypothetical protein